ncbi:hypothetical protein BD410DRAFT_788392 [Rickenella mellea]|uniref:Uncharacterized protein n=1 Tax=Rickenella mellea TaxID=50990 RepID=A0A4Y7Q5A3_9AGAM|nr:hypothetical protein BD410DRAFT_788392 [Rickenella mellea]
MTAYDRGFARYGAFLLGQHPHSALSLRLRRLERPVCFLHQKPLPTSYIEVNNTTPDQFHSITMHFTKGLIIASGYLATNAFAQSVTCDAGAGPTFNCDDARSACDTISTDPTSFSGQGDQLIGFFGSAQVFLTKPTFNAITGNLQEQCLNLVNTCGCSGSGGVETIGASNILLQTPDQGSLLITATHG